MNDPITYKDALIIFVIWQALVIIKDVTGLSSAITAAIAVIAVAALGLLWRMRR